MAHRQGATLIRYSPCKNYKWPVHSWNFNMHQVQLVQPQFAQEATHTFLRICHCPPYGGTETSKCNDYECRLYKHVVFNGQMQPLVSAPDPTYLSRLVVQTPQPPHTPDIYSRPPALKMLVLVKEVITHLHHTITMNSVRELDNLGQVGRNIVQTIMQLIPQQCRELRRSWSAFALLHAPMSRARV